MDEIRQELDALMLVNEVGLGVYHHHGFMLINTFWW